MGFFTGLKERFRDRTMEKFCAALQGVGVDARLAARGRPEEKITSGRSLGLIDMPGGSIQWTNVRTEYHHIGTSGGYSYHVEYGVPDSKVTLAYHRLRIRAIRVKNFPLFGRVVDLHWEGDDLGLELIGRLNGETSIKNPLLRSGELSIRAYGEYGCWIISTHLGKVVFPSAELWTCYQTIARHLLAAELPTSPTEP